jgi:hypothetical protein
LPPRIEQQKVVVFLRERKAGAGHEGAVLLAIMGIDLWQDGGGYQRKSVKFAPNLICFSRCSLALGDRVLIDFNIAQMQHAFPDVLS